MAEEDKDNASLGQAIRTLEDLLEQNREILEKIEVDNEEQQAAEEQKEESDPPTLLEVVQPQQVEDKLNSAISDGTSELALRHSREVQEIISSNLEEIIYNEIRKASTNVQNAILKEVNAQLELTLKVLAETQLHPRELPPVHVQAQLPGEVSGGNNAVLAQNQKSGVEPGQEGQKDDQQQENQNNSNPNNKHKQSKSNKASINFYRQTMEKTYDPHAIEQRCYEAWETSGYFQPSGKGQPYCIMLPPPNVTGSLHMGHAFQDTLMDILVRYHRMKGDNTLWQCGTDHAGIATQMVVERQLAAKGEDRHNLGREKFTDEIWKWKEESGGNITRQLRRMGTSMDWSRERFTLDEGLSESVVEVFVRLHEEGLIYRGKRLVNWDPVLHTAISDLEVISEEENGHLWHIKYPIVDSDDFMVVATTRPETMLGDAAVAVHPEDSRYEHLIGASIELPLCNRTIPVIADEYVDPEFGSGCVKITPAHDFNDYEVGQRHDLLLINVLTDDAAMNDACPMAYQGMDRYEARKKIIEDLQALGLVEKIEDHKLMVPRGDRSQAVVEPYLTDQWYVKAEPLAKPAIEAVENGDINFIPENWSKTYFEWMRNIDDWCISRQLWWGHRIPAWYDQEGNVYVGRSEDDVRRKNKLGSNIELTQDPDVLDTWFSSALWPFSTLGWPKETPEFKTFYPTNVLVTGFDIIFFWVARMIMMGLKFTGEVPFKEVYIHGLVRDSDGQKMSKSKGNILDPIDLIDGIDLESLVTKRTSGLMQPKTAKKIEKDTRKHFADGIQSYGTDALRFTFAAQATLGRDIRFDLGRIDGYRNFCNKIWNASRYVIMTTENHKDFEKKDQNQIELGVAERWIVTRFQQTVEQVEGYINAYRFDLATQSIYEFIWDEYCDWYLELSKATLTSKRASENAKRGTRLTLLEILESLLRLIHPFMPFISEELWQRVAPRIGISDGSIMTHAYPQPDPMLVDDESLRQILWVKEFVLGVRRVRAEMDISPGKKLRTVVQGGTDEEKEWLRQNVRYLVAMAKLESIGVLRSGTPPESATALAGEMTLLIPLEDIIEPVAEKERLNKELEKLTKEKELAEKKLANPNFVERAPAEVVKKAQDRLDEIVASESRLSEQLTRIEGMIKPEG